MFSGLDVCDLDRMTELTVLLTLAQDRSSGFNGKVASKDIMDELIC